MRWRRAALCLNGMSEIATVRPELGHPHRFPAAPCTNALPGQTEVVPVKLVEIAGGREAATAQAALGGSWGVSLAGAGMRISAMASTPM